MYCLRKEYFIVTTNGVQRLEIYIMVFQVLVTSLRYHMQYIQSYKIMEVGTLKYVCNPATNRRITEYKALVKPNADI
jgi:hypothetical protein